MPEGMVWVLLWCFVWPAFWGVGRYFRARQRIEAMKAKAALALPQPATLPPAQEEELKLLRERVKVLERIVVDNRRSDDLAGDIERLR